MFLNMSEKDANAALEKMVKQARNDTYRLNDNSNTMPYKPNPNTYYITLLSLIFVNLNHSRVNILAKPVSMR